MGVGVRAIAIAPGRLDAEYLDCVSRSNPIQSSPSFSRRRVQRMNDRCIDHTRHPTTNCLFIHPPSQLDLFREHPRLLHLQRTDREGRRCSKGANPYAFTSLPIEREGHGDIGPETSPSGRLPARLNIADLRRPFVSSTDTHTLPDRQAHLSPAAQFQCTRTYTCIHSSRLRLPISPLRTYRITGTASALSAIYPGTNRDQSFVSTEYRAIASARPSSAKTIDPSIESN